MGKGKPKWKQELWEISPSRYDKCMNRKCNNSVKTKQITNYLTRIYRSSYCSYCTEQLGEI